MPSPLASQTIARIQQALRSREAASLPEVITLIEELSSRAFSISVPELADLISRDTMVTAKVIQSANTFGYNPFGHTVTTVTQAIQVVGFNKIRNLALSMLLVEKALHGAQPEVLRESAALALCSGLFAQALTTIHPEQDSEQAFVFACLRHYGRLLLTTFMPEQFQQVHERPVQETEPEACRRIFGITPLELTHHLFEESRLPRVILRCLQDVPQNLIDQPPASAEERLTAITHFAAALGELVVSPRVGAATFADQAELLRAKFSTKLLLTNDTIDIMVKVVDQNLRTFSRNYGTKVIATGVFQRIAERANQTEPLPVLPEGMLLNASPAPASAPAPAPASSPAADASPPPPDGISVLTECLIQLSEFTSAAAIDVPGMDHAALSAIRRALDLQDCVLFQRDPGAQTYTAQTGLGALLDLVRGRPVISAERRDVFSICLNRREDVLIRDTSDPKIRPFLPEWLLAAGAINGFILLPLSNNTGVIALIVGTRSGTRTLQPAARELQLLKAIRQHLVSARRLAGVKA
ncbi:MAG: HDOD domain-containing protein [Opitutaceae bacterium]|nr:HDOD domain-containing protein [Opitutaceae bacterium]